MVIATRQRRRGATCALLVACGLAFVWMSATAGATEAASVLHAHAVSVSTDSALVPSDTDTKGAPAVRDDCALEDGSDLLTWSRRTRLANDRSNHGKPPRSSPPLPVCGLDRHSDRFLIIGVKTRAVRGFPNRQVIRQTWGNASITHRHRARVFFLACEPPLDTAPPDPQDATGRRRHNATLAALEMEKQVYGGDVLTHELDGCVDSYFRLVDKVTAFFHWAAAQYPRSAFVMMADDDVYVRLDRVVALLEDASTPRTRYYAGQVPSVQEGKLALTIRDPHHKNYLSPKAYPISTHCPRSIGAHYLMSMDLVKFFVRNSRFLRGTGTIEDLSIGFWLRSLLQVRPVHLASFDLTITGLCHNSLASYGEVSRPAIRRIHRNLAHGDPFCRGFAWKAWATPNALLRNPARPLPLGRDVELQSTLHITPVERVLRTFVVVTFTDSSVVLPSLQYAPALQTFESLCTELRSAASALLHHHRPPIMLCDDVSRKLDQHYENSSRSLSSALLALAQSSLRPLAFKSVQLKVWLSSRVLRWRLFIECLMAQIYAGVHVFVVDETLSREPTALLTPTFAVVDEADLSVSSAIPQTTRLLVFSNKSSCELDDVDSPLHGRIYFTLDTPSRCSDPKPPTKPSPIRQLYAPLASLVFSDSLTHSPLELLLASSERRRDFFPLVPLVIPHYCSPRAAAFVAHIAGRLASTVDCTLDADATKEPINDDGNAFASGKPTPPATIFALDADVNESTQAQFVLAFERHQHVPGSAGGSIVAAFLAGSVPIYDGDDETVARLFNPRAFVSCGRFASLRECADFVVELDRSPVLYGRMRRERPVVNATAFDEVFSWHPDVLARLRDRRESVAARLEEMINSV